MAQSIDGRLLVAALDDVTVRWYRTSDGKMLLSVFVDADLSRWFAFTPAGYYATSPRGDALVRWEIRGNSDQPVQLTQSAEFRDHFLHPNIIANALSASVAVPRSD